MSIYLNVGSLMFGFVALIIPLAYIIRPNNPRTSIQEIMLFSFMLMGLALVFQLMYQQRLASINDLGAFLDIIDGVVLASWIIFLGTLLLNLIRVVRSRKRTKCRDCSFDRNNAFLYSSIYEIPLFMNFVYESHSNLNFVLCVQML